jgi:glycosyltransferase involved in cell wall biosynthesis
MLGVFIYQRISHLARRPGNSGCVVAPVPYFPKWLPGNRWDKYAKVPCEEKIGDLKVYHPRYFLLPGISMPLHGLLMYLGSRGLVRKLHREMRFQLVDGHYVYPDGFAAVLLAKMLGIPAVVSARGTDIHLFPSFRLIRPLIRWTLRNAAGAIAVCSALRDCMLPLGSPVHGIQVIGNGVDPKRFYPVAKAEARQALNIPETDRVLVAVGRLIPVKGFQFLLPAVSSLTSQFPNLRLYIVGEGESRGQLQALAENLKIADRVKFVGSRPNEELRFWYGAADCSCLVSSREGWPNVLLESMACGTPIVATGVWGVPEVITSKDLGIMVEQTPDAIAAGIREALIRRWDRDLLASCALSRDWDQVAKEVEEYETSCISSPLPKESH